MASAAKPKISNDEGASEVFIGVKEFECIGAEPPYDHPHVYLDMGSEDQIICPYCSTLYRFKADTLSRFFLVVIGKLQHIERGS